MCSPHQIRRNLSIVRQDWCIYMYSSIEFRSTNQCKLYNCISCVSIRNKLTWINHFGRSFSLFCIPAFSFFPSTSWLLFFLSLGLQSLSHIRYGISHFIWNAKHISVKSNQCLIHSLSCLLSTSPSLSSSLSLLLLPHSDMNRKWKKSNIYGRA